MAKTLLLFFFLSTAFVNCFSQNNVTTILGTKPLDDNILMSVKEVTIKEWMEFIVNNEFDSSLFPVNNSISESARILFDDLKRGKDFDYLKIVKNYGKRKSNFGSKGVKESKKTKQRAKNDTNYFTIFMPITGITFRQAQKFCSWKENLINTSINIKVTISLPSISVYKQLISNKDSINIKKCPLINYNSMNCNCLNIKNQKNIPGKGPCKVDYYWPNSLGLYNLQGNVSEMTNKEGIAMGGSFRHFARESYNDKSQTYSKAEDWLGFRYIVISKE